MSCKQPFYRIATSRLNRRIVIEQDTGEAENAAFERVSSWSTLATVWAEVVPLSGREEWRNGTHAAEAETRVRIRYRSDVTPDMRIKYGSRYLYIRSVRDLDDARETLEMICTEESSP